MSVGVMHRVTDTCLTAKRSPAVLLGWVGKINSFHFFRANIIRCSFVVSSRFLIFSLNIMEQWLSEGLSKLLDFEVPEDMIKYVLSIENESDLNEYMKTLLDFDNPHHKNFLQDILRRKFPSKVNSVSKQPKKKISKNKSQHDFVSVEVTDPALAPEKPPEPINNEVKTKKKTKFVNLYSQEGKDAQVVMLKGRHSCECEATDHELVNNCLECGRIVCEQEGSGPCLFCGSLVCTEDEDLEINSRSQDGSKLKESLMERSRPEGWEEALALRDRLLDYDRNSEQRTRVTDDDSDYFNTNSVWLSESERDKLEQYQRELHEKKHASRRHKKMTFDFAGRQIVEDNTIDYHVNMDKIREITGGAGGGGGRSKVLLPSGQVGAPGDRDVAPGVNAPMLIFDQSVESQSQGYAAVTRSSTLSAVSRVQDEELQVMSDAGRCLSMHQPWASLLVEGIKLHEGRTWYSSHRGRLWIASASKPPEPEVVRALENQYTVLYPDKNLKFPSFYPTGCLLGCVHMEECLPQEEYQRRYPGGESDSPYVFICSNPISLRLRFPIKGQHKIYSLDKAIHHAALKDIQTVAKMRAAEANAG